jgi:hypothetical protein
MFALPALVFAIGIWLDTFKIWIYSIGVTSVPIGIAITVERFDVYFDATNRSSENLTWLLATFLPLVFIILGLVIIAAAQSIESIANEKSERISAVLGLLLSVLLLWGEFLPWIKTVSQATSNQWTFKGSGTQILINECCYLTSFGLVQSLKIIIPISFLGALFLIRVLGYGVPGLMFASGLVWCFQEGIDFLSGLGVQTDLTNTSWTQEDIDAYGLSQKIEGLFGGYLFIFSFVGILITLLIPRVLTGKRKF